MQRTSCGNGLLSINQPGSAIPVSVVWVTETNCTLTLLCSWRGANHTARVRIATTIAARINHLPKRIQCPVELLTPSYSRTPRPPAENGQPANSCLQPRPGLSAGFTDSRCNAL